MTSFKHIQNKLEQFISRYYTNELIKGCILFITIGLLYFLLTLFIEYVLWLNPMSRRVLFWLFILVEFVLFIKLIVIPIAELFKLKKRIDYVDASKIIGKHFPQVNDKLLNVLQLKENTSTSELLLASIEQKSIQLNNVPFKLAVNLKSNLSYLKYAAIPIVILIVTFLSGNSHLFSESYKRIVHYKTAYEPPAPFKFFIVNHDLQAIENKAFTLKVKTAGEVFPENAQIVYNDETYFLNKTGHGEFEYIFTQPKKEIEFQLIANTVISKPYILTVVETPSLLSFEMVLNYPKYTHKPTDILKSTGNALVPEGTHITWRLKTKATSKVNMYAQDTLAFRSDKLNTFKLTKRLTKRLEYSISTSNKVLEDYENLAFKINVVKDEFPELNLKMKVDSLDQQTLYFYGQVSDDYGFSKLEMVYYPEDNPSDIHKEIINIPNSTIAEFITTFPNNVNLQAGVSYQLYFQVFDNDVVNNLKVTKSRVFTYRKRTQNEEEQKHLEEQQNTIQDLNQSLSQFEKQEKDLEELSKAQKEKSNLNFSDKKKLESFLKRQVKQDAMMKNFNKKLQKNLNDFQKENNKDSFNEDLKKRFDDNEKQLKKDEKLLQELKKIQDKINQEELVKKLDELAKQNKNKKRSLEQLLELTKRFYVEKKLEKIKTDLQELSDKQEQLSNKEEKENTKQSQELLNEEFKKLKDDLNTVEQESKDLKKPIEIPRNKLDEQVIESEQRKATQELDKKKDSNSNSQEGQRSKVAQTSQKKAAQKMREMSQMMQSLLSMQQEEAMQEDVDMLRQILDNLILFSFAQEELLKRFNSIQINHNKYASFLRKQHDLKEHFEHIDDSLFALSLRQPKLSEIVNNEITAVYYNIDKALNHFSENELYQGVSNQQFTITAANNLADFLSNTLDNIQMSMSMGSGEDGKGDMQLPDIIISQEKLNKMMKKGMKDGKGKPSNSPNGKQEEGKAAGTGHQQGEKHGQKGTSEDINGQLYQIYQEQQALREALKKRLTKMGKAPKELGDKLLKQIEDVELDLLNKGFTEQTLQKMMRLQHQLLKLENASLQQEQDSKRKSNSNTSDFQNKTNNKIPTAKQYFNTTEILNRQSLPLLQIYRKKVQEYFKQTND